MSRRTDLRNLTPVFSVDNDGESIFAGGQLVPKSGQVSTQGDNVIITPAVGRVLRIYYTSYNPPFAAVEVAFRFGSGILWLRNAVGPGSVIAKDFGDLRFLESAVNEPLVITLGGNVLVNWNVFYVEIE